MDTPYQATLSPIELFMAGTRHLDRYSVDEAVADYLEHHPLAVEAEVRAQIATGLRGLA
jgi:hypothetical protein